MKKREETGEKNQKRENEVRDKSEKCTTEMKKERKEEREKESERKFAIKRKAGKQKICKGEREEIEKRGKIKVNEMEPKKERIE